MTGKLCQSWSRNVLNCKHNIPGDLNMGTNPPTVSLVHTANYIEAV